MADWIKVRHALVRSPKLLMLAREMKANRFMALGFAVAWLVWLDEQSGNGETGLSAGEIDEMLGIRGLAAGLERIGWVSRGGDGTLFATEFGKHCGASAKRRAEDALRKAEVRKSGRCPENVRKKSGQDADQIREEVYIEEEGVGNTTADKGGGGGADAPPDGFYDWLGRVAMAHPSCSMSRTLAPDVEAQAVAAFLRCPQAAGSAELLGAYLRDKMPEDRYRRKFYRPVGQAFFFRDLEDVLAHAERWARETGWGRKKGCKAAAGGSAGAVEAEASEEDREEFLEELRKRSDGV